MIPVSHAEAVRLSGGDPWLRLAVLPGRSLRLSHDPDAGLLAVARRRLRAGRLDLVLLPTPGADPERALPPARPLLPDARSVTVGAPPTTAADALGLPRDGGVGWEWWWTDEPPPAHPAESEVTTLPDGDPATHAQLVALLTAHSPRHSAIPGASEVVGWVGIRRGAALVACAAWLEPVPGIPLLASVAVRPDARGRGLGAAVTASITRRAFATGSPAVTVDLYADNHAARRLYARLGFRLGHRFTSWSLTGAT